MKPCLDFRLDHTNGRYQVKRFNFSEIFGVIAFWITSILFVECFLMKRLAESGNSATETPVSADGLTQRWTDYLNCFLVADGVAIQDKKPWVWFRKWHLS